MGQTHSNPTTFLLVRHAETIWNHEHRHAGSMEVPLSHDAERQIARLTKKLVHKPIKAIYSSPLTRCQITIHPVAEIYDLKVIIRPDIMERDLGKWEQKTLEELLPTHPGYEFPKSAYTGDYHIPEAETLEDMEHRVRKFLHEAHEAHPGQHIVAATHSGVIWMIVNRIVTNPPSDFQWPSNCSICTITTEGNHYLFESFDIGK